ncbi:hypothetical protein KCU64_g3235, partial [Aureobasidium melanogenum]
MPEPPLGVFFQVPVYVMLPIVTVTSALHIRPQSAENWASRPLCHIQAVERQIRTTVGDHVGIPAAVRFASSLCSL